jgi:hypothetical protein
MSSPEIANPRGMLVKAVVASTVGTAIEWYDFFLFSTITPLVFAKLFFPNSDPLVGTLQAFLIYFVGFLARPVGAFIFGHYGDRVGRKAALITGEYERSGVGRTGYRHLRYSTFSDVRSPGSSHC